jgi:hypothetical protein
MQYTEGFREDMVEKAIFAKDKLDFITAWIHKVQEWAQE